MHGLLLLLDSLLLLLDGQLLPLKLVLMSLELCEVGNGFLSLSSLILLHPLKDSNQSGVRLRCRWSGAGTAGLCIMSAWRHPRNRLVVIV